MANRITHIRKRDGRMMPFEKSKIADAIFKAARAVGGQDRYVAEELASAVTDYLNLHYEGDVPGIEDIQDMVEKVLMETGHAKTAKAYILYRDKRAQARRAMRVRKATRSKAAQSTTDAALLVDTGSKDALLEWDKGRIAEALEKEASLDPQTARKVASAVEQRVLASGLSRISTGLVRELVDNELFERGLTGRLERQKMMGMPRFDLENLIFSKSQENSNISQNNPEAINLTIAETVLKQFALGEIFSRDLAEAHLKGRLHLHDLGYPTRVYCSSHSLEYLKKYGLDLENLDTKSAPAKHARTLTGHLNTFLASMQAYYAGALGVAHINIMYAPYVEKMSDHEMRQEAQHLIFSCSQSAFSRGGQTLFLDFNVHTGVPGYLKDVPAIGPGGAYTGRTYGQYEETAQRFCRAMLDVWRAGDRHGHLFAFPKCDFHINAETFTDPAQRDLLDYACRIASENGVPYFIFDRDECTLSACCRLRTAIEDRYMMQHPESMRFCGFQNVTVNLPQAAYRVGPGQWEDLQDDIAETMDLAMKAHLQKREFIRRLMESPEKPLWQIGKIAKDGRPYVDLDKATYIIGLVGLNECIQHMSGEELHESDEALKRGLRVIAFMYKRAKQYTEQYGLKVSLEESPADLLTRIRRQAKFHNMIESGAILHAFVGENLPPPESILRLVRRTYERTPAAQLTISPEFTVCNACHQTTPGLKEACAACGSEDVYGMTRIVGYFSRIANWNKSKLGELKDRERGNYSVTGAVPPVRPAEVGTAAG